MDRRQLLKTAGAAACVAAVPKIVDACVYLKEGPQARAQALADMQAKLPTVLMRKPKPNVITCGGETCADLGMTGRYPNCYYPQYLYLNTSLVGALKSATLGVYSATMSRTITQAQLDNLNSLRSQLTSHLSVNQTAINEGARQQWIGASIYDGPSQANYTFAQEISNDNGLDANIANNLVYCGMPQCDNTYVTQLHNDIMNLPNSQALDQLSLWSDAVVASVSAPAPGWLQTSFGSPEAIITVGEQTMAMASVIGSQCQNTGPAAPDCYDFAGALALAGFLMYGFGYMLQVQ